MSRNTASDSIALAKALNAFNVKSGAFVKAAESVTEAFADIKTFGADKVAEYETQISAKRKEAEAVSQDLEHQGKKRKLDSDLAFEADEYARAITVLEKKLEVSIKAAELKDLREALGKASILHQADLDKALSDAKKSEIAAVKAATTNQGLVHKAEIAELSAATKQKEAEVEALNRQIKQQQNEIAEQRKVTLGVAEAGRQGSIQQSFGKQ